VHAGGELPTPGAIRRRGAYSGRQLHPTGSVPDVVEHDLIQVRQQPSSKIAWPMIIQLRSHHDGVTRRAVITQSAPDP
jgi:hypothetical protein